MAPPSDRLPWRLSSLGVAAALATGLACSGCAASVGHVADPPTYEALKTFITREHVGSVEQVVAALPPSYLEHHALMFETRSLQAASFERPRAIVYGTDASFVIAFDGQPADSGGALETMEFDRDTRRFVLREIAFEDGADGPRATFSDDNPAACKTCHGVPEHPIWDSYPTWPGAYGEVEGVPPWMAAREKDGYAAFLRVRDEDPRYRSLVVRDEGGVALDERRYHGSRQTSANAELGALLARWNAEAVVHQLIASPKIEQELLGALVDACADHDLATDAPAAGVRYSAFLNALGATEARRTESIASRMPRTALPVARSSPMALARFRFLADVEAGISPDRWALSPRGDAFDLPISRAALTNVFLDQAAERDPAVREELSAAEANGDCAAIRTRQTLARGEGL